MNRTPSSPPRVVWVTRSFLDYRVPVFAALDRLLGGRLHLLYSGDYVPAAVQHQVAAALGPRAEALMGEWRLGREDRDAPANRNVSLRFHPNLYPRLRRLAPEALIADGFFKWTLPALALRLRHGVPLVIAYERTAHTERHAQWPRLAYRRWVVRHTDAMNCSGSACRDYAVAVLGMSPERIRMGHMVADVPRLQTEASAVDAATRAAWRARWAARGLVVLCVGRLVPGKGGRELLAGWTRFERAQADTATLVFVGEGPERSVLEREVQRAHLRGVRFAGAVPHTELAPVYAAADALILPTLEDNWSLVVPEAMACGLPVACSRFNGGCPEMIAETGFEANGWIFDPREAAEVARVLESIGAQRDRLATMGRMSRQRVQAFAPDAAAATLLESCRQAVARREAGRC